jgi:hypothetical protein
MNLRAPHSVGLCQRSRRLKGCNVKAREHIISSWQDSEHDCSAHSIQAYVRASRSHDCCVDETLSAASKAAGAWIVSPWHACPECSFCCCDIPLLRVQTSFSFLLPWQDPEILQHWIVISACSCRHDSRRRGGCTWGSQLADMRRGDSVAAASRGRPHGEFRRLNCRSVVEISISLLT